MNCVNCNNDIPALNLETSLKTGICLTCRNILGWEWHTCGNRTIPPNGSQDNCVVCNDKKIENIAINAACTSAIAVNDFTCPSCGNTRCSKTEKSCWSCGNNLHK